jgi:ubiquinone/menaquinone biosynthesis C-methylase UbiE
MPTVEGVSTDTRERAETYSHRNSTRATDEMAKRTATVHAAFFLPHLQPGMRLLDAGCGPGTITLELAQWLAPGEVIGIDQGAEQIATAKRNGAQQQIPNVRFEVADIYTLPFPDSFFDAVYCNAVLAHLQHPAQAIHELSRVLKPGGVVGLRNGSNQWFLIAPPSPLILRGMELYMKVVEANGGSPYIGHIQHALLREAGFVERIVSASLECSADPTQNQARGETAAAWVLEASFGGKLVELGLTTWAELQQIADAWRTWGEHPDSFMASPWCEVVSWKP